MTRRRSGGFAWRRTKGLPGRSSSVGLTYASGEGVPQDDAEAVRWYRLAADQGDASAQINLGVITPPADGVRQDDAEAVRWYRLAVDEGNASAQYNLGLKYDTDRRRPTE